PQILQCDVAWRRGAEAVEADHVAFRTDPSIPALPHAGFDGQPSGDRWRQNFVAIVLGLLFKQFDAGHRHDSRRHAVFLQLLTTFESEPNFGASSNQDQLGIDPVATALGTDTVRFSQHVSALAQAFSRSEL